MSIETALCTKLSNTEAVTNIIGTSIYPNVLEPGAELPALVYQQISGARDHVTAGASGLAAPRFQITCWAETYAKVDELADAVRVALDGFAGTVDSVIIQCIHLRDESDMPSMRPENREQKRYGKRLDFQVWHKE